MNPAVIVIVDIISNSFGKDLKRRIVLLKSIEHLVLQSSEECFHNAVVIAVALSGHRLYNSMLLKFAPVKCVLVLPALIRVHNQTLYRRKSFKRFIQHILDLFHVRTGREIVGNNLIGIHVKNRRNVAFTPRQIELRYICCSLLKRLLGTEIPIDNVISDLAHIAFVGMVLFLGAFAA